MGKPGNKNQSTLSNIFCRVPNACSANTRKSSKPKVPGISPAKAMYNSNSKFTAEGLDKLKAANIGGKFGAIVDNAQPTDTNSNAKYGIGNEGGYARDAQQISSDKDVVSSAKKKGCGHKGSKYKK